MVDRDVVGDLEQPARELELRPVLVDVVQDLDERVLREILGGGAITHHPEDEGKDRSFVAAHELPERVLAPSLGERDDVRIGAVRQVEEGRHSRAGNLPVLSPTGNFRVS